MKRMLIIALFQLSLCCAGSVALPAAGGENAAENVPMMSAILEQLLQTLDEKQRQQIQFPFEDAERFDWHFVPRERRGLSLKAMSSAQRDAVSKLLGVALSEQGATKVENILFLEKVLQESESPSRPGFRDPELYFLTLFGSPSGDEPWGWRFEGHHLSLNFSSVSGFVAGTPAFYGANPAEVPAGFGSRSGLRALGDEEDLGRTLLGKLDDEQKRKAIFSKEAPREIITGAARGVSLGKPVGLSFAEMSEEQQDVLREIVAAYIDNMDAEVAENYWRRIGDEGWHRVHFAWAGGREKGQGHYYRIQGPTFVIEYDNVQNNAKHVHSVLRDLEDDWGEDFLRQHYEQHDHP